MSEINVIANSSVGEVNVQVEVVEPTVEVTVGGYGGGNGVDGVGIESVEQTTTSTADGGTNIITVTKTDGTSSTFRVQNGSKGSKGDPGYTPQKGIDYFDGQPGTPGRDGSDGQPGKDGYTPVKGKDYFDGKDGNSGKDGVSPTVAINSIAGGHRISITDASGTKTADVMDGAMGEPGYTPVKGKDYFDGNPGKDGVDGSPGKDGTSVTVKSVSESSADGGSNVVTFSDGKTLSVKNGSRGSDGSPGADGKDGYTPVKGKDYFDGNPGRDGADGSDGFSPTVAVSNITGGHRIAITDKDGTKHVDVMDGSAGAAGQPGKDGVGIKSVVQTTTSSADGGSNVITVTKTDNTTSTFTVKNGSKGSTGDPGKTPVKGTDYFTSTDKTEMVNQVKAALTSETWTFTLSGGSTVTKKVVVV